MKATINVIRRGSPGSITLQSFPDNEEGNLRAETLFKEFAKQSNFSDKEIEFGVKDGFLESYFGTEIYLIRSMV